MFHDGGLSDIFGRLSLSNPRLASPLIISRDSVIFVNENENENGEKWENNEFVNEN